LLVNLIPTICHIAAKIKIAFPLIIFSAPVFTSKQLIYLAAETHAILFSLIL
jgi:hypothetical protein